MRYSLRRRLLFSVILVFAVVWSVTSYRSYISIKENISELIDAELAQSAHVLMALVKNGVVDGSSLSTQLRQSQLIWELTGYLPDQRYERKLAFQLWTVSGRLILRSSSAPLFPMSEIKHGFSMTQIDGKNWQTYALPDHEGQLIARVAQTDEIRVVLTNNIAQGFFRQAMYGLPLLALLVWIVLSLSLKPVSRLAKDMNKLDISRISKLPEKRIPVEFKPLINAFNTLYSRVKQIMENERRFTSDAAHELRTPLAGIKTQAQVALKSEDPEIKTHALVKMDEAVDRLNHTLQQLLTLSRLYPESELPDSSAVNLTERVTGVVADLEPSAFTKNIDIILEPAGRTDITANAIMLDILIRNLIDNAIRYTPRGGQVIICVEQHGEQVQFRVEDSGPGIPDKLKETVLQRFFRQLDTVKQTPGSGLGLSIVDRITKLHKAELELEDSVLGGLRVKVNFVSLNNS